ncbi:MAG: metallophosphoesterase [Bacteroidales bacterium]|nr:metallophosphoesterase [Bacteroidales bacterium]
MKSKVVSFSIILALIAGYFLFAHEMPAYTGRYLIFVVLLFMDLYLWSAVRKTIFSYQLWLKKTITFIFWLPLMMVVFLIAGGVIKPIIDWNDAFKTYWVGFILVFYAAKLFPMFFLVIADLVRLVQRLPVFFKKEERRELVKTENGITRSKFLQYLGYLTGGMVFGTMLTGMFKWVYDFNIIKKQIHFDRLPVGFDGFKVLQISDLHLGTWTSLKPLEEAVKMINSLKADLVIFSGDLVNFATKEAFKFEDVLKKVTAPMGVYCTLGNHDYGDYVSWPSAAAKQQNLNQLFAFYKRIGWKLMNNRHVKLERKGSQIALIGVENWGSHARFPKRGDLKKATLGLDDDIFKLLVSHDPTHWDYVVVPENYDMDLTLSGHTHGFQFGIEMKGIKWSPAQYLYREWAGLYKDQNTGRRIYVNRGLGSIGYPGRIGILPEITLFELKA